VVQCNQLSLFYDNPIIEIRRIILAGMFVEKDLSEMECKIDNKII
jgi:hypothetical protein